ncbi:MAG: ATP-dependent DNA helicase UvrD2 [Acidimicrobiales bacterium]
MVVTPISPARQAQHLLGDLTSSQRRAVETPSPTVCVVAAAGAGKTRVLTRRIAYRVLTGQAQARHAVAITFTRKAAGELGQRLGELGLGGLGLGEAVAAGTFHSFALSQLRRWWADRRTPEPTILARKARLLAELAAGRPGLAEVGPAELAAQVEWAKARLVPPESFAGAAREARRELPASPEAIAALYARYEDEKRRRRVVDFDDLLHRYAGALSADSRFAAAQRWRWRHVFVDELQDVNPLQCRLLVELVGDNDDLFVVGDPNQAIYGWNGSDPGFLADFALRWPQAEVVRLDDNHRSSPQVVAAAAAVLGRQGAGPLRSSRPNGPLPSLRSFSSHLCEAAGVATEVHEARSRGLPWSAMSVLTRTNSQLDAIAGALAGAGVPYRCPGRAEDPDLDAGGPGTAGGTNHGDPGEGSVTLSSFHRAKGLQWPAVWICGLEAGLVPIVYASDPPALAEERRLLYVALTRAERELHCSWARRRQAANGAVLGREPSPWLPALALHCAGPDGGTPNAPGAGPSGRQPTGREPAAGGAPVRRGEGNDALASFLCAARRRLSLTRPLRPAQEGPAADPVAAATGQRLREWRRRLARASGVPPHVLLHDSTVELLAARRPATSEGLLAIPGLGPVKVARYGPAILEVLNQGALAEPR